MLSKPNDKRALELMAKGWEKSADKSEAMQRSQAQNKTGRRKRIK
jgi:hypothetical protein